MSNRKIQYWVISPESDREFVASMEDVLETYALPYDPSIPVVCMDEQPVQLLKEKRAPPSETPFHAKRVDYEYERAGTAYLFMLTEPLSGWRKASARQRHINVDWAFEVEELLRTRYAEAEKIILVCDNLNTHTRGVFYEAFSPDVARDIVKRIEFHYIPKHESWLTIAKNKLSSMTRQCLKNNRRMGSIDELRKQTEAWASTTNEKQRGVDW